MPTEHSHVMGGSTAARRINCPGSYQAEKAMPDRNKSSEYADRGSMLHAAMELIVTENPETMKDAEPLFEQLLGQDMGYEGHEITQDLVDEKLRPATNAWIRVRDAYGWDDWFIEERVSLESVVPGAFGTSDLLGKDTEKRLHVLDWKFGDGVPVPVEGNYGAGFYAAAAMYDQDPEIKEFCEDISAVVLHIVQPRTGVDEDCLHTWETTEDWIEQLVDLAVDANNAALSDDPPIKTGSWCRWCEAKSTCPEHTKIAVDALSKEPKSMTSIEMADYLNKAYLLQGWIKEIFELAQQEMEAGAAVPGFKLVRKRATRVWTDPEEAERLMRQSKLKVDVVYDRKLRSPAQIEKKAKNVYSKKLSKLVESRSSGLTLVPESDKRPAVTDSMSLLANAIPEK